MAFVTLYVCATLACTPQAAVQSFKAPVAELASACARYVHRVPDVALRSSVMIDFHYPLQPSQGVVAACVAQ